MTPKQIAYVARRRSQIRYWPWLALLLVALLAAGYGWLWWHAPININPFLILDQFSHKTVSDEEMILLAARGSLALVTCGLFLLVIILLISVALLNESRLIRLLDEATAGGGQPGAGLPPGAEATGPGASVEALPPSAAVETTAPDGAAGPVTPGAGTAAVAAADGGTASEPPPANG